MTLPAILSDRAYPALKQYILTHTGLAYYAGKDEDLAARLARRFAALGIEDCSAYLELLMRRGPAPSEIDALIGELTIGETYFFRQTEHFDLLRSTIVPELLRANRATRRLRIWSAGCAIGAEPYSVAILLREFAAELRGWDVHILGTDINVDFLAQARSGIFSPWTLRDVPATVRTGCFTQHGKQWVLNPEFRQAVTFRYHNLTDDSIHPSPDGLPFDLILCRNVMIYFAPERIRALARRFYDLLEPGGWLLPGHAEYNSEIFSQFGIVSDGGAMVYRKAPENGQAAPSIPLIPHFDENAEPRPAPVAAPDPVPEAGVPTPAADSGPAGSGSLEEARILADRGQWDEAEAICRQLLDADALNAPAYFTLGLILAHKGSPEAAFTCLRRAIYVDRRFALAYYYLGALLRTSGDLPAARKAFENATDVLASLAPDEPLEHGDGIKAGELRVLAQMHRELIAT